MYLRFILVFAILAIGAAFATQGPFYALLFYLWNAYFRPEAWTYGPLLYSLNLSWVIGIYLVAITFLSMPKARLNARTGLVFLFFLHSLLCAYLSENPVWSWNSWEQFSKVLVISYLIVVLVTDERRYRLTLLVIALSLGLEAAKQGWAQLVLNPGAKNDNNIPFLGDNNGVALGMMMLVPLFGALAQTASSRIERYMHRFLLVGVLVRGITTYSRGGFLAAAVLAVIGLMRSRHKIRYAVSVAMVTWLFVTVMPETYWDRISTINAPVEERDDSTTGRLHFWQVGLAMANAKPFTGVGFDGYLPAYQNYNWNEEFYGDRAAHSVWFGLLADLGYPGFILFVIIWSWGVLSAWRISRECKGDPARAHLKAYADALLSSLIAFAVGGTFLSVQYGEMIWHLMALSTALTIVVRERVAVVEPKPVQQVHATPAFAR